MLEYTNKNKFSFDYCIEELIEKRSNIELASDIYKKYNYII